MEIEEFAGSGSRRDFESAETVIRLSQALELGGKRSARSRLAGAHGKLAGWDFEAERLIVLTETTLGFIDVLAAQEQLRLAEDFRSLSRETFDVVIYSFLGLFKIVFLVFNVVPYVALLIVT